MAHMNKKERWWMRIIVMIGFFPLSLLFPFLAIDKTSLESKEKLSCLDWVILLGTITVIFVIVGFLQQYVDV